MTPTRQNNAYDIGLTTTWIVVAHRAGAKLFESRGPGKSLETLQEIGNPAGRLKTRELVSDRPGRSFSSSGAERHSLGSEDGLRDHVSQDFARELRDLVEKGRAQNRFDRLVLVAAPDLLGRIRSSLSQPTLELLAASFAKDLPMVTERDLADHLDGVIKV